MTRYAKDAQHCADALIQYVGKDLRVGAPLGCGKPNHLINALYRRAKADPSISLTLMSALTLEKPKGKKDLEKRFVDPLAERLFKNYPDLEYELDRMRGALPPNVKVEEFYFIAGKYLNVESAQQDYIASHYTHVARDILERGINVLVQQVAKDASGKEIIYSLSTNADLSLDVLKAFRVQKNEGRAVAFVGQVNDQLPFMYGDAVLSASDFDYIVDEPREYYELFAPPKASVGDAEFMIGLYGSTMIKDGGEIQVGIGALGDALTYSMLLRHQKNTKYLEILRDFKALDQFGDTIARVGGTDILDEGLFGSSEMFVDGFLHLMDAKILKRKVYDDLPLQKLLTKGTITEKVTPQTLEALIKVRVIDRELDLGDFKYLKHWGIFKSSIKWDDGHLVTAEGERCEASLRKEDCKQWIHTHCLGQTLKNGYMIHAGFFMGPQDFYERLRQMPEEIRRTISMRSVTKVNQLFGHEEIDRLHRKNARFINTCLMVTLLGAAVSDGLEDGRVVSGIGGQYNFVSMAHALPGGRSILNLRSTRGTGEHVKSSIVWKYGNISIPRQLRDVVITEYGIAMLRSKTDSEVIAALLNICDSRFQAELLAEAKLHKKIAADYEIPKEFSMNYPETYMAKLKKFKKQNLFPRFPFGTTLTEEEKVLSIVLKRLKAKTQSKATTLKTVVAAFTSGAEATKYQKYLERMDLYPAKTPQEILYSKMIVNELKNIDLK